MVSAGTARVRGYTLIELMVTLGVIATITAIGLPAANDIITKQRVRSAASDLQNSLMRARSFATKLQRDVTLVPVDADAWQKGWTITNPNTVGGLLDAREALKTVTISGPQRVVFHSNAHAANNNAIEFEVTAEGIAEARCVRLDLLGSPEIVKTRC